MLTPRNLTAALQGKVVVVTGASSGIGRALAGHLARHGARVMLVSRSQDKLEALRREIAGTGGQAWVYPTDLADMSACQRFAEQVLQDHSSVDILINNAGRSIRARSPSGPIASMTSSARCSSITSAPSSSFWPFCPACASAAAATSSTFPR